MTRARAADLGGQLIGGILVIGRRGATLNRDVRWSCLCAYCRDLFFPTSQNLKRNRTGSCGCNRPRYWRRRVMEGERNMERVSIEVLNQIVGIASKFTPAKGQRLLSFTRALAAEPAPDAADAGRLQRERHFEESQLANPIEAAREGRNVR